MLTYNFWEQDYYKDNKEKLNYYKNVYKGSALTINLNFAENNNHGCRFHCKFCPWAAVNYGIYVYPKDEDVLEFINKYALNMSPIRLCGGGEPLYNFEKNKEKLKHLTDVIKSTGRATQMTTKDIKTLAEYYDSPYLENVVSYNISIETCDSFVKDTIAKLLAAGKQVRISKILNFDCNQEHINIDDIKKYLDYYQFNGQDDFKIVLRTNYVHALSDDEVNKLKTYFMEYLESNNIATKFNINKAGSHFKMLQLTNSEVTHCSNTEEQLFFELSIKKEDYGDFFADITSN